MFNSASMHTNHVHVYGSSKCEITSRLSFGTFGPAVWPNFSSLSLLWQKWFFASQKEKYWEHISSSFATCSLLFAVSAFPWSEGPTASGRLGKETRKVLIWPCAITGSASSGEWGIWWDFTGWLVEAHAAGDCHATSPTWASVSGHKPSSHTSIHM